MPTTSNTGGSSIVNRSDSAKKASEPTGETVTLRSRIIALLGRVRSRRLLLGLSVPGSGDKYNSAVIDVDPDRNILTLDGILSPEGHAQLKRAGKFRADTRMDGIELRFSGTIAAVHEGSKSLAYEVPIPERLYYGQRRDAHRVSMLAQHIPVTLKLAGGGTVSGEIRDLSVSGAAVRLPPEIPAEVVPGLIVPECVFRLPSGEQIAVQLEVRTVRQDKRQAGIDLGGRFIGLDRTLQRPLESFITSIDREHRKRQADS